QTLDVVWSGYRATAVGQVAPADVPRCDCLQVGPFELGTQGVANRAIDDARDVCAVLEQERKIEDVKLRCHSREERVAGHAEINRTTTYSADELLVRAQCSVRECLDLKLAISFRLHALCKNERRFLKAVRSRMGMCQTQTLCLREAGLAYCKECDAGGCALQGGS